MRIPRREEVKPTATTTRIKLKANFHLRDKLLNFLVTVLKKCAMVAREDYSIAPNVQA